MFKKNQQQPQPSAAGTDDKTDYEAFDKFKYEIHLLYNLLENIFLGKYQSIDSYSVKSRDKPKKLNFSEKNLVNSRLAHLQTSLQ